MFYPRTFYIHPGYKNIHLTTCTRLTENLISKHPPLSPATKKGHLKQEFNNIIPTTKIKTYAPLPDPNPEPEELLSTTHDFLISLISKEKVWHTQTLQFATPSSKHMEISISLYVMIMTSMPF